MVQDNPNPLLPTQETLVIHLRSTAECTEMEHREETDDYHVVLRLEALSTLPDGSLLVAFECPPVTAQEKFAVGQHYEIDLAIQ